MGRRQTLVQLTEDLVDKLDRLASKEDVSRSELIRRVLSEFVEHEDEGEKERRHVEGYRRIPQHARDEWGDPQEWAEGAAKLLLADLGEEDWKDWDEAR